MKNDFNKELLITKEDDGNFENSTKFWICDHAYVGSAFKVRGHFHISRKQRDSEHGDYNINVHLNQKIPVVFHNLITCESHHITQETDKVNSKINVLNISVLY